MSQILKISFEIEKKNLMYKQIIILLNNHMIKIIFPTHLKASSVIKITYYRLSVNKLHFNYFFSSFLNILSRQSSLNC